MEFMTGIKRYEKQSEPENVLWIACKKRITFRDELGDIRDVENLNIDIDGFLAFADFFFDGFVADIFVQSKIRKGQQQVREAIRRVEDILSTLQIYT